MEELQELEIRSRGVADLVESWKSEHEQVRQIWRIEDLVAAWLPCFDLARRMFEHFRDRGSFPNPAVQFSYYVLVLEHIVHAARLTEALGAAQEQAGFRVDGLDRLKSELNFFEQVIEEDRFASRAAMTGGAMDNWD